MKQPILRDDEFLLDVRENRAEGQLNIWWLGQSGFLVQLDDAHLLLDPYLSDSLTKKYADTPKPHVRMTERVIAPERLDFIDVVTSSHNHTDHLDGETVIPLLAANPGLTVLVPGANVEFAATRFEVSPDRLSPIRVGEPMAVGPFTFHAMPAAHEEAETDGMGQYKYMGYLIEIGGFTIYHSGDTVMFAEMLGHLSSPAYTKSIDVAILPINGRDPARGVAGNLSAREAVELARAIDASVVIPCHYDMFEFNTVEPYEFMALADAAGQTCAVLLNGGRLTF